MCHQAITPRIQPSDNILRSATSSEEDGKSRYSDSESALHSAVAYSVPSGDQRGTGKLEKPDDKGSCGEFLVQNLTCTADVRNETAGQLKVRPSSALMQLDLVKIDKATTEMMRYLPTFKERFDNLRSANEQDLHVSFVSLSTLQKRIYEFSFHFAL